MVASAPLFAHRVIISLSGKLLEEKAAQPLVRICTCSKVRVHLRPVSKRHLLVLGRLMIFQERHFFCANRVLVPNLHTRGLLRAAAHYAGSG